MKWSELSAVKQLGVVIVAALVITGLAYYFVDKAIMDANDATSKQIVSVTNENNSLRPYENKIKDLDQQIANLKQQLDIQKHIVPDEKEADNFIRMVQSVAASTGVEIRLYTAKPTAAKEFYVEAPFDLDLDGPYYSMLNFFDKLAKQERIVTVSNLQMASVDKSGEAKVKHKYNYAPTETVVASCVATTYFSREAPAPAAGNKPVAR